MFNILVQALGYIGVLCFIISYAQKSRKNILVFSFLARAFFVVHYILLGGYAGSTGYEWLTKLSEAVSFITRFDGFVSGQLNVADIVYMLTVSALFVFLSVRSVEKRRWA